MLIALLLAASCGLCYAFRNKAPMPKFFQPLLDCPFCTGFHTGILTWALGFLVAGQGWVFGLGLVKPSGWAQAVAGLVVWAFASAAVCDALDALLRRLEDKP